MKYSQILRTLNKLKDKGHNPQEVVMKWTFEADENDPDIEDLKLAIMHFEQDNLDVVSDG